MHFVNLPVVGSVMVEQHLCLGSHSGNLWCEILWLDVLDDVYPSRIYMYILVKLIKVLQLVLQLLQVVCTHMWHSSEHS